MGRSMRVTTNNCHPRQSQPSFRTYYMNNTISFIHHTEMSQAEIFGILCQSIYLCFRNRILNRFILVMCRSIVIRHTIYMIRTKDFHPACAQSRKSLRTSYFMTIKPVYIKLSRSLLNLLYHMGVPNLIK